MACGRWLAPLLAGVVLSAGLLAADDPKHSAAKPVDRPDNKTWAARHKAFQDYPMKDKVQVLFLGDALTQGWEGGGKVRWNDAFKPLGAANFGITGDRTQHVLWRITKGEELKGLSPKVVVLQIGGNNLDANSPAEIVDGIAAIVQELHKQLPQSKVLLVELLPRGAKATDPYRDRIKEVNEQLKKKFADDKQVRFVEEVGKKLLAVGKDRELSKDVAPDGMHLSPRGYEIWAEVLKPVLQEMLK